MYGSDVSAVAFGSGASAAALALVPIRGGGVGAVPGFMGLVKGTLLLAAVKSVGDLVMARCPSSVVVDMMDNALASIASWNFFRDV